MKIAIYSSCIIILTPSAARILVGMNSGYIFGKILFSGNIKYQSVDIGIGSIDIFVTLQTIYLELIKLITGVIIIITYPELSHAQLVQPNININIKHHKTMGIRPLKTFILGLSFV